VANALALTIVSKNEIQVQRCIIEMEDERPFEIKAESSFKDLIFSSDKGFPSKALLAMKSSVTFGHSMQ
jgi:hypothetical protein